MKDKIMILIIGILIGAIISTICFLIYSKSITIEDFDRLKTIEPNGQMGEPPMKPEGNDKLQFPKMPENVI